MIKDIIDNTENAIFDRCHFIEFSNSSLDFELVYYIPTSDYVQAMSAGQPVRKFGEPKKRIKPTILPLKPNDPKKHK